MGEFATTVQEYISRQLAISRPALDWQTEHRIAGTPVDVAGFREGVIYLIELEWRRADPADNTAKLFRHLDSDTIQQDTVHVFQVFTRYYDLGGGGHSSKRKNAEFVGTTAARISPRLTYHSLTLEIDPPKRGGELPTEWQSDVSSVVELITGRLS